MILKRVFLLSLYRGRQINHIMQIRLLVLLFLLSNLTSCTQYGAALFVEDAAGLRPKTDSAPLPCQPRRVYQISADTANDISQKVITDMGINKIEGVKLARKLPGYKITAKDGAGKSVSVFITNQMFSLDG